MEEEKVGQAGTPEEEEDSLPLYGLAEDILSSDSPNDNEPGEEKEKEGEKEEKRRTYGEYRGGGEENLIKLVTFFLKNEEYGLPISQVQEINRVTEITKVPNSPEHVKGVINLRGRIVPVIELNLRLNLGETELDKNSRIVLVEYGPKVLGLMVDSVAQVLNISPDQIEDAPEEVLQISENFVKGIGKIDDRMIILLELEKVIQSHEDNRTSSVS